MAKRTDPMTPPAEDASRGDSVDRNERAADSSVDESTGAENKQGPDWLGWARSSYENSTDFLDSSLRTQWERNERAFQSRHPPGSKYYSDAYKGKSRIFRPKTRTAIRQGDAALAASMFTNKDVASVDPVNENDPQQRASAAINKEILQYRLSTPNPRIGIPWFLLCVGAGQDAQKYGIVFSKQSWEYESRVDTVLSPAIDEETGEQMIDDEGRPLFHEKQKVTVVKDRPRIDLIPPENLRIDRAAHWTDPINTSPFLIVMHPMYLGDVEMLMQTPNQKTGQPPWKKVDRGTLKSAAHRHQWDTTRQTREGNREDSKESDIAIDEFMTVWVHENFVRYRGRDYVYFTAGIHALLTDPVPMEEVYRHCEDGNRPVTFGYAILETHKIYPSGKPQLTEGLQAETNEIANSRIDNLKLALNKRYFARRGAQIDLRSLLRNVSASVTLMNDPEADVKVIETRDVTAGSYQEQDRINVDFDDVTGGFSPGTVQSNRRMNETVGGMQMISGAANLLQELDIRVFITTWVEATLSQVVKMIQAYEDDETIIALAGERAQIYQRFGINTITDQMLRQELTVEVNVGIGATDPERRLNKILVSTKAVTELLGPKVMQSINAEELINEIYAAVGYRDGRRFYNFRNQDPMVLMLMQQLQELQKVLDRKELEAKTKRDVAQIGAMAKIVAQEIESGTELKVEQLRAQVDQIVEAMRGMTARDVETRRHSAAVSLEDMRGGNQIETELIRAAASREKGNGRDSAK